MGLQDHFSQICSEGRNRNVVQNVLAIRVSRRNRQDENVKFALLALLLVWSFAAFGEEIAYRGYLLTRAADLGRRSATAYWVGMVFVSVLFGYGHFYKGPSGIIDSGVAGLILGSASLISGRNLWTSILAHGFIDTFGVTVLYFGWDS